MSQKSINEEDYLIGSRLLRPENREIIHAFYKFARALDDMTDDPKLVPLDKEGRILGFEKALYGKENDPIYEAGNNLHVILKDNNLSRKHPATMLKAFMMDVRKDRYASWGEVRDYGLLSTAPVGRFYLDLHGESQLLWGLSDSICVAIQVLNNLRDAKSDFINLNRVYLPGDWMTEEKAADAMLGEKNTSPELRQVFNRVLDQIDQLLNDGECLIAEIRNHRLALEISILLGFIQKLSLKVRSNDVLADKIQLTKKDRILAAINGLWIFLRNRIV